MLLCKKDVGSSDFRHRGDFIMDFTMLTWFALGEKKKLANRIHVTDKQRKP